MKKLNLFAGCWLLLAACQAPVSGEKEKDSVAVTDSTELVDTLPADSVTVIPADTAVIVDSTLVPGRWLQPVQGIDSVMQGFNLRKNGKAESVNMHSRLYDKWKLQQDTLLLWSHAEGDKEPVTEIDTLVIKMLNDTSLVVFPTNAAPGYLEKYTRKKGSRKGK
ncbi:lipocalin-like domain-containing protein [Chitinophaga lutea]|nr:lipocalin family protein [Chitinophaga lutea]